MWRTDHRLSNVWEHASDHCAQVCNPRIYVTKILTTPPPLLGDDFQRGGDINGSETQLVAQCSQSAEQKTMAQDLLNVCQAARTISTLWRCHHSSVRNEFHASAAHRLKSFHQFVKELMPATTCVCVHHVRLTSNQTFETSTSAVIIVIFNLICARMREVMSVSVQFVFPWSFCARASDHGTPIPEHESSDESKQDCRAKLWHRETNKLTENRTRAPECHHLLYRYSSLWERRQRMPHSALTKNKTSMR